MAMAPFAAARRLAVVSVGAGESRSPRRSSPRWPPSPPTGRRSSWLHRKARPRPISTPSGASS